MITQRTVKHGFFYRLYDAMMDNARHVTLIVGLIVFFIAVALGYMFWMNEHNKSAQRYFGALVMEYNRAKQDKDVDFQLLLKKFEKGYQQYSRSSLLPYYKDYAVNILMHQHKNEEALALLDTMLSDMQASPLLPLYQMERALIALDMADVQIQEKGKEALVALAQDKLNPFKDSAQFYLGRYYWTHDNVTLAKEVWQTLVDEQADQKAAPSPWVQQVKDYLTLVVV